MLAADTLRAAAPYVRARRSLLAFVKAMTPGYRAGWVHAEVAAEMEAFSRAVAAGESPRLILTMPPRHGKSRLAEALIAWHLGHHPRHDIIAASYALSVAQDRTRAARALVMDADARLSFPALVLRDDTASKTDWRIVEGGGAYAAGVRGGITGKGAHILLIDDPVKDWEAAQSPTIREATWGWYTSTAVTRLAPGAGVLIIQCMTGDTPVLLPNGATARLDSLRKGDMVATYENGNLSTSSVVNWKSCGRDYVFAITMTSGRVVRANGRHPFLALVEGETRWIRTDHLTTGLTIVALKGSGASGKALCAPPMDANCQQNAKGFALPITTKRNGQTAIGLHPSTRILTEGLTLNTVTASPLSSTTTCCETRVGCAPSASEPQKKEAPVTGRVNSALITATTQVRCGVCSATFATSPLAALEQSKLPWPLSNTLDFDLDRVLSVEPAGEAEVFDIQIDRTENFVANGLVSHNTRWQEDDLTGRVLEHTAHEGWRVVNFPAIAEVVEQSALTGQHLRSPGQALHPARYPLSALENIRATLGSVQWSALYQQRPTTPGGEVWRRGWFRHYTAAPAFDEVILSADLSAGATHDGASYPVIQAWGRKGADLYLLEEWRRRCDYPAQRAALLALVAAHSPRAVLIEDAAHGKAIIQELRGSIPQIVPVPAQGSKLSRAHAAAASIEQGRVWLPDPAREPWVRDWLAEVTTFPAAANDDRVDAAGQAVRYALQRVQPNPVPSIYSRRPA